MSKKNAKKNANIVSESDLQEKQKTKKSKQVDKAKPKRDKKARKQKVAKKGGIGKKFKETSSELKKITWPNFSTVVKQTGVVIAVVIMFTVILFGVDRLLGFLFSLITKS